MFLVYIIGFVFLLGLVILIHELGHFIMAKRAGILCHEFALGMGPIVYSKKKGETLYSIRAIPIGGFVSMAGEEISDDLIKKGQEIKVLFDEAESKITHIILDPEDHRYPDALRLEVERVDLKGKEDKPLFINAYEVKRNAFYVMEKKNLQIAPYERSFESKTWLEKFLTIFSGPLMNFILAFVLFVVVAFMIGLPQMDEPMIGGVGYRADEAGFEVGDTLVSIGDRSIDNWSDISSAMGVYAGDETIEFTLKQDGVTRDIVFTPALYFYNVGFSNVHTRTDADGKSYPEVVTDTVKIGSVGAGSPANNAGLISGDSDQNTLLVDDVITRIGYTEAALTDVSSWTDVVTFMRDNKAGSDMVIEVDRDGDLLLYELGPFSEAFLSGQGVRAISAEIGIGPMYEREFFGSFHYGMTEVVGTMGMIFSTISALFAESRVGVGDLAGPVGIYSITSQIIDIGFVAFVSWIAILSVNLGIINLLPIPALDGGRLVFLAYEGVTRRPVNKRVENTLHFVMFVLLITLFVFITFNDIVRLFS